jgi:hypothetical protein
MAVTGPKLFRPVAVLLLGLSSLVAQPDHSREVRAEMAYVAAALANGNPTDALTRFEKTMEGYDTLADSLKALTESYDLTSQLEILNEEDGASDSTLKLTWTLDLTDRASNTSTRRVQEVTVHLKERGGKWKITALTPLDFFNPQPTRK